MKSCLGLSALAVVVLAHALCAADTIVVRKDGQGDLTRVQEALESSWPTLT